MDKVPPIGVSDGAAGFSHPSLSTGQNEKLTRFAQLLQDGNRKCNLTRVTKTSEIYLRHFADALQVLPYLDSTKNGKNLLDVGSGAGVPGLVLAIARSSWSVLSLEATAKKVRFQQEVVTALSLENTEAMQGRAEVLGHVSGYRETFAMVTARAVAAMPILIELCLPLVEVGGLFIAFKGPKVEEELALAKQALSELGGCVEEVRTYSLFDLAQMINVPPPTDTVSFQLVVIRKETTTPGIYPRDYGTLRRRPL